MKGEKLEMPSIGDDAQERSASQAAPLWFMHTILDEEDMSPQQVAALNDLITPLYERLVLSEKDALLRATGNVVVFSSTIETLTQPGVMAALRDAIRDPEHKREAFETQFRRYLNATRERHKATDLHLRLRRANHAPWSRPIDPFGIGREHGVGI